MKVVNKAVKKLEQSMKKNLKMRDQANNCYNKSESRDSRLTIDRPAPSLTMTNKQSDGKMKEGKKGRNLLSQMNQESEVRLNEDWNHQKEGPIKTSKFKTLSREVLEIESSEESKEKESSFSSSVISSSSSGSDGSSSCS